MTPSIWNLERYAWHKQEYFKGTWGAGSTDWAGWGFERNWLGVKIYSEEEANAAQPSVLMNNPVFEHDPEKMFAENIEYQTVNSILSKGIPALSPPAGINKVTTITDYGGGNLDISTLKKNGWPRSGGEYNQRWLHSDFKNVAYFYTYGMFDKLVEMGKLK